MEKGSIVLEEKTEDFRDHLSTVDGRGKRIWVYPKMTKGYYTRWRHIVSYTLLSFFILAPFIRIHGDPMIMLNVVERHFILFGAVFWPQDFHIFLIGMLTFMVFIVLFTVIYGRIFCGWICPQTLFMEMVFRKIEYLIEGDAKAQRKLDYSRLNGLKFFKKLLKHIAFFSIAFSLSNLLLIYIIGSDQWYKIVTDNPFNHLPGLGAIIVFTSLIYLIFGRLREQVCTNICPYGRLQGVLMDKDSVIVSYDYVRGENRAKLHKGEDRKVLGKGDCVDCSLCVQVCPTGIDIRNGSQLECIQCTACIDACDEVMHKINLPKGLIRYSSENAIKERLPFRFTRRMFAYSSVLVILIGVLAVLLLTRRSVETTILRTPGMLYQDRGNGNFSNLYNVKVVNKSHESIPVSFKLHDLQGEIKPVGTLPQVPPKKVGEAVMFITLNRKDLRSMSSKIKVDVFGKDGVLIETVQTTFVSPANHQRL